jgi:tetratricopeptide (TPR) repeat protein
VPTAERAGKRKAVTQVEQMHQSKCFKASKSKLGCATCHDPHEPPPGPDQRVAYHRNKCLECHEKRSGEHPCTLDPAARLKESKEDSCIDCHMQRLPSADIVHTAMSDHSIPRSRDSRDSQKASASPEPGGRARGDRSEFPLVDFHRGPAAPDDPESCRDLGLAIMHALAKNDGTINRLQLPATLELLERAARAFPSDLDVLLALAGCLRNLGKTGQAAAVLGQILERQPDHERALLEALQTSLQLKDPKEDEKALDYNRRLIDLNPSQPMHYFDEAIIHLRRNAWREALAACDRSLRLDPTQVPARILRACCYHKLGDSRRADEEVAKVQSIEDPEAAPYLELFRQMRQR